MSERRDRQQRIRHLQTAVPFIAACTPRELARIDGLGTQLDVREGVELTREGAAAAACFVVLSGTAVVNRGGAPVGVIGAGSVVGEMALLDGTARTATVVAASPMRLLVLTSAEFEQLVRLSRCIEAGLNRIAAERRAANNLKTRQAAH
jgi:CRP-like cAMP-binding protein